MTPQVLRQAQLRHDATAGLLRLRWTVRLREEHWRGFLHSRVPRALALAPPGVGGGGGCLCYAAVVGSLCDVGLHYLGEGHRGAIEHAVFDDGVVHLAQ